MRIADHFGRNPKENPLLVTVLALFGQFRQLFVLNYLYWLARRRGTGEPSDAELMRALKVGNVFAINELRQAMPRWPNNKVFGVLGLLREYDGKSKGTRRRRRVGRRAAARTAAQNADDLIFLLNDRLLLHRRPFDTPGRRAARRVYLYQRLRTVDYRPLHTAAHLSRLRDGAGSLFGRPAELPAGRIADEIGALLHANGYPAGGATVTLRLYADGTYALTADGVSLYRTYALRSLRPAAAVVPCDGYRPEWPTSARRETARWAQQEAERSGARCALLCDRDGIVRRAGDAPLFAVRDDVIYAAPLDDVEWTLVAEAARRAGIRWVERPVGAAQLRLFDELFSFDCEGVSSIASFEGTPYLSLTAERIAAALAALPER